LGPGEDAAREKYADLLKSHGRGEVAADPNVYDLLNLYLAWVETNRPLSLGKLQVHLKRFGKSFGKTLRVSRLKPHHVQTVIDSDYAKRSDTYKNDAITAVKGALFWAIDQGYITTSPIARMKKPPRNVRETFIPAIAWQDVLGAASDRPFRDYLTVAFSSGARPHEMRTMEARYFDRDNRRIVFPRLKSCPASHGTGISR
jgi:integrase